MDSIKSFYKNYDDLHFEHHLSELSQEKRRKTELALKKAKTVSLESKPADQAPVMSSARPWKWQAGITILMILGTFFLWNRLEPESRVFEPVGAPSSNMPISAEKSHLPDRHWPMGTPGGEEVYYRETYILSWSREAGLPRWAAFHINKATKSCVPGDKKDPEITPTYNHKIEGYQKGTLIPPRLVCGGESAKEELSYQSLNVPMTPEVRTAFRRLDTHVYTHMLVGPFLNQKLRVSQQIAIPERFFVILAGGDLNPQAWWIFQNGKREKVPIQGLEQKTEIKFLDVEL